GQRVAPEPVDPAPHGPPFAHAIVQIEVTGSAARRAAARPARYAVLEPTVGQELLRYAEGLVELADLTQRSVGHEVHGVLPVPHGHRHAEAAGDVGRVEPEELAAPVRLDRPAATRLEGSLVALDADEGRAHERGIRDRD